MLRGSAATVLLVFSVGVRADAGGADISGTWRRNPDSQVVPPPLKEPYASAYKALRKSQAESNDRARPRATPNEKCKVEGMPTIMAAHDALEILQTPGQVTVLAEYMTQTRRIYLDEPLPALEDVNPGYMGYSVGNWHGNTLGIQTIGVGDDVRYMDLPHSAKMTISEKIHLTAPDRLQDDITIVDPDVLTRPYRLTFSYRKDARHRILEYACDRKGIAVDKEGSGGVTGEPAARGGQPKLQ
jgi:hypothetical protein